MSPSQQKHDLDRIRSDHDENPDFKQAAYKELLYDGWFYDVTEFSKRHPGGQIIDYYTQPGEDATLAIQQFHHRSSKKVTGILNSLKRRRADNVDTDRETTKREKELTRDFNKLCSELENEGMFQPSYTHIVYRFLEIIAIGYLGYTLLFFQNFRIKLIGWVFLAMAQGRSGWLMHEGGHYSLTGKPKLDKILQGVVMGVFLGLSPTWWNKGHNRHHAMPQRLDRDVDIEVNHFVAYNVKSMKNPLQGQSFFIQKQVNTKDEDKITTFWYYPRHAIYILNSSYMWNDLIFQKYLFLMIDTLLGFLFWRLYQNPKHILKHRQYTQMLAVVAHYYLVYQCGFWAWFFSTWLMSIYLFGNFALSHSHLPVTNEPTHWVEYGFLHTVNVNPSIWCDWWMGYLNYQIEHHLFPTMPQFRHPQICHRVKAFAKKHGLPYHVFSYKEVVCKTLKNLGNVADELKTCEVIQSVHNKWFMRFKLVVNE